MPAQCVQLVADPRGRGGEGLGGLCLLLFGFFFFFFFCKSEVYQQKIVLTIFRLGFLMVARLAIGGGGGGGQKVLGAYNSKSINNNEMKFGEVVNDHKLINFVWFN